MYLFILFFFYWKSIAATLGIKSMRKYEILIYR